MRYLVFLTAPYYDSTGSYQATNDDLRERWEQADSWIDTNWRSTHHYAFLTGFDNSGFIGIAYRSTACIKGRTGMLLLHLSKWHFCKANSLKDILGSKSAPFNIIV